MEMWNVERGAVKDSRSTWREVSRLRTGDGGRIPSQKYPSGSSLEMRRLEEAGEVFTIWLTRQRGGWRPKWGLRQPYQLRHVINL